MKHNRGTYHWQHELFSSTGGERAVVQTFDAILLRPVLGVEPPSCALSVSALSSAVLCVTWPLLRSNSSANSRYAWCIRLQATKVHVHSRLKLYCFDSLARVSGMRQNWRNVDVTWTVLSGHLYSVCVCGVLARMCVYMCVFFVCGVCVCCVCVGVCVVCLCDCVVCGVPVSMFEQFSCCVSFLSLCMCVFVVL